jgi:hypothetical protein
MLLNSIFFLPHAHYVVEFLTFSRVRRAFLETKFKKNLRLLTLFGPLYHYIRGKFFSIQMNEQLNHSHKYVKTENRFPHRVYYTFRFMFAACRVGRL